MFLLRRAIVVTVHVVVNNIYMSEHDCKAYLKMKSFNVFQPFAFAFMQIFVICKRFSVREPCL